MSCPIWLLRPDLGSRAVDSPNHILFSRPHWFFNWISGQFHQAYYSGMFTFLITFDLNASVWNSPLKNKRVSSHYKALNLTLQPSECWGHKYVSSHLFFFFLYTFTTVNFYTTDFRCFLELISCACWRDIHVICDVAAGTVYLFPINLCLFHCRFLVHVWL